jgi:NAD(P)-dependent dehydrogenase (short-subunit alcohol dehydrogenase family)
MKIDFSGQVAVVTGAGGGIGLAVSLMLGRLGAKVLAVDRNRDAAESAARQVRDAGAVVEAAVADVRDAGQVRAYVAQAMRAWGRIDVLMNNAGWQGAIQPVVDYPDEAFDDVMAINVRGVFLGLKHVLPVMIAQGRGAVVNTASLAGHIGTRHLAPYTASKHAVLGLTKAAALEVARMGVRVNAVCPGPVDTDMIRAVEAGQAGGNGQAFRAQRLATIPNGRYATAQEVAQLMVYLASDWASHITGEGVHINGGQYS